MKMNLRGVLVACIVFLLISSCNDGSDVPDEITIWLEQVAQIDSDLAGTSAVKDPQTGISMIITKLGTGLPAQGKDVVDVDYVGRRYSDKVVFDDGNTKLNLSTYIEGWQVALSKLPEGSEAKVIIPSLFGYRSAGYGASIPGNTILEFDIKFNKVIPSTSDVQLLSTQISAIDTYLDSKGITAVEDTTGIRYVINQAGPGPIPSWFSKIHLIYTIKLLTDDAKVVTTIEREPTEDFYSRPVDYIHGMKIALQKLRMGSKAVIYVPAVYAFGADGATSNTGGASIPGNANIILEVEIINVQ
jgi:FKBP-type peptidyl-prolyl cis-trans isomerase